jgi:hypothetical protein
MKFTFVCACGKIEELKIYVKLRITKVGVYDLAHPCDGYKNIHIFFEHPLLRYLSVTCLLYTISRAII